MTMYRGRRDEDGYVHVTADGKPLDPRLDLDNHSPTGFEWGYGGSGPAQLALAMLADVLGDDEVALRLHQRFKWKIIAGLDRNAEWQMRGEQVRAIAAEILSQGTRAGPPAVRPRCQWCDRELRYQPHTLGQPLECWICDDCDKGE